MYIYMYIINTSFHKAFGRHSTAFLGHIQINSSTNFNGNKYLVMVKPKNKWGKPPAIILYHRVTFRSVHIYTEM